MFSSKSPISIDFQFQKNIKYSRMKRIIWICFTIIFVLSNSFGQAENYNLNQFPKDADPVMIGNRIMNRFLESAHSQYGSPLRANEPRTQITYPDVCLWLGGIWFANVTQNNNLFNSLEARFEPLFTSESFLLPKPNHVDNNVFGALALELYMKNHTKKYLDLGMKYANAQWELPKEGVTPEQKKWSENGYSWQTRIWLDDMFMITTIQAQAYRVMKDTQYINRAAREMIIYLDSIQLDNGLFYHSPTAPFAWGRGNGWMAVGMTELLRTLPADNSDRPKILKSYLRMMRKLKECQNKNGMWNQLVDDKEMWEETSGTAMFTYAMIVGVKNHWLDEKEYGIVARKGWLALVKNIDPNGDVKNVCEGTMVGTNRDHYKNRLPLTGDLHGQAPALWCAYALLTK